MGTVVKARAGMDAILAYARATQAAATARGEETLAWFLDRLGPGMAAVEQAAAQRAAARVAKSAAWEVLRVEGAKAKGLIAEIKDAMWNRTGRPRQSPHMDQVFPDGLATYTASDLHQRPILMKVLQARVLSTPAPAWNADRAAWVAQLDARRASLAAAAETHWTAETEMKVASATYRTVVRSLVVGLQNFKRDLLSSGLNELQVHDIMPDVAAVGSKPTPTIHAQTESF